VAVGAVTIGGVVLPTPPLIFPPLPPTDPPKVRERRFPPQPPASRQIEAARNQDAAPLTGDEGLLASGQRSAPGEVTPCDCSMHAPQERYIASRFAVAS
jgi:hypothetical protein